ncbi:inositol 2-dehydrogenase [Bacteroidetes bacterium SCGC AAA795-G10]|nr:inositol 2-dehydrogenase [Bacteroidetes bacterium SCGC AAA795-G10]
MRNLRFGIVGLGRMGKIHFDNINLNIKQATILGVSNLNPENKKWVKERSDAKIYDHYDKMVRDSKIDAIIISSPTSFHIEHINIALKAGKAIFCEKPVELSFKKVKLIKDSIKDSKVPFMVGFNRRYDQSMQKIKKSIKNGTIGTPQIIGITSRDPAPPDINYLKTSGGLFLDMAIHDFDMACFLNENPVESVYSTGSVFGDKQIENLGDVDTAVTTLNFENGSIATINNSRKAAYGYDQRVEVFGDLGMCATNNQLPDNHFISDKNGIHTPRPIGFFFERYADSYRSIIKEFISCLIEKREMPNGINSGLNSLHISLAAKKSFQEKRVVYLKEEFN